IQKKLQAEAGPLQESGPVISPRWVGSGWTIFNNKGNPVRQYEPFFSASHRFEFAAILGVGSVLFYDPLERVVATLNPNDTWEKVVFDPWHQTTWDVNDTSLLDPRFDRNIAGYVGAYLSGRWRSWHDQRVEGALGLHERVAAEKTAAHAGTPPQVWLDILGRAFLTVAHNRVDGADERYATRVRLDVEGNQREFLDARGRSVVCYGYDFSASRVLQASMDAGERLLLTDVLGKTIFAWNSRGFRFRTEYDPLRRPLRSFVRSGETEDEVLHERTEYGEGQPDARRLNLRLQTFRQYDGAGVVTNEAYDFKGNLLRTSRQLAKEYRHTLDWTGAVALEEQHYATHTSFDALNRPVTLTTPDSSVVRPHYNKANLLERLDANIHGAEEATEFVAGIDYNARGQRTVCAYGNGVRTTYDYDQMTFRLSRLRTLRDHGRLQDLGYTYDPAGNITHISNDAQQTIFFRNRRVEPSSDYTYDAIYRLIEATGREHLGQFAGGSVGPWPPSHTDAPRIGLLHPGDDAAMGRYVERYSFDEAGNFLRMIHQGTDPANPGWTRTYQYNEPSLLQPELASNRLSSTAAGDEHSRTPLTYDTHGNTTSLPEVSLMRWNHKDQLEATAQQTVLNGGTPETTYYLYDAAGQRVRKVTDRQGVFGAEPSRKCERVYVGDLEIYREFSGETLKLERETLHIVTDQQRIALVETRTEGEDGPTRVSRFQISNHLGSAQLELDETGKILSYEEYYPYGSTSYQASRVQLEAPKRYRYTGKERDEESGLYYHRARYYAPWLGRWTSCDAGMFEGVGQGWARLDHPYVYVENRPVVAIDPDGGPAWFVVIGAVLITSLTVISPANAPGPGDPTYRSISELEFGANVALNVVSGGAGSAVGQNLVKQPGSKVLAGAVGGTTAGGLMGVGGTAVSDVARGEASPLEAYARNTVMSAGIVGAMGLGLGLFSRVFGGPATRPSSASSTQPSQTASSGPTRSAPSPTGPSASAQLGSPAPPPPATATPAGGTPAPASPTVQSPAVAGATPQLTVITTNARMQALATVAESGPRWVAGDLQLFTAYTQSMAAARSTATQRAAFNLLRPRMSRRVSLGGPIHHWRYPIQSFASEATAAENLYLLRNEQLHLQLHRAIGVQGAPYRAMQWGQQTEVQSMFNFWSSRQRLSDVMSALP
ncbi:MAG: RHS repeat-associated core domain-containing protein, partial [Actinomycetota bacterium]|nr:RHS repeat-associated core domain-containing protein [Actinomycetota bacterium]